MKSFVLRLTAAAGAACMFMQAGGMPRLSQEAAAVTSYRNAVVANQADGKGDAVIRGNKAEIVYDNTLKSNVLSLGGGSFGAGWLQLPEVFSTGCTEGFTIRMRCQLASGAEDYTRLYQFSSIPFGSGNGSYNSPDISMDLNNKTAFRASVFAGTENATENDKKHRSIFTLSAAPDSEWHDLAAVYTPDGAEFYLDGKALTKSGEGADTLAAACASLFSESLLPAYKYCGIGHSLYNDNDLRAKIDNVEFYAFPLKASQLTNTTDQLKPVDPLYYYTFEPDTITEAEPTSYVEEETSKAPDGTAVSSVPEMAVTSPDGTTHMSIWKDGSGRYYYSVNKDGDAVILPSRLGLNATGLELSSGFDVDPADAEIKEYDEEYDMPFGKHTHIRNHYYELTFPLKKGSDVLTVFARVYDDGVAVRYALNRGASGINEQTQVMFPGNSSFWGNWPNATYEWDMVELPKERGNETNATYSVPYTGVIDNQYWVTVAEANVFNTENPYCAGALQFVGNYHSLRFKGGVKVGSIDMRDAFETPWRAVIIGDTLTQMAGSDLILNLNPPSVLDDTSWIKPGKVAWSWWSSGGDSPVEYHMQKEYIDFAAENGWDYVCVDFGWALWDDSEAKIKELCDYGKEKGIGIYLWYGVNNKGHNGYKDSKGNPAYPYYSLLDEATIKREFERVSSLGVKGVKVDYYESDTQETMKQMYLCMKLAAENHMMVLFHGCTVPKGESRTFPNVVSFEAINGCEYYKWFTSPSLQNRVSYPMTRCVIGPADFTPPGIPVFNSEATAGFALADTVAIESGVQHYAHSVYTYEGSSALPLLNDIPVVWDDMKILDGRPMQFNITARRSGSDWYISTATISPRTVSIPLSELVSGGTYNAYIFRDNADGSDLVTEVRTGLTAEDVLEEKLMTNGGAVIKLTPGNMRLDTPYSNYQFYEAENAKISGKASVTSGKDGKFSSGGAYVGYVGGGADNAVTFENIEAPAEGDYTLRIYYISGEQRSLKVDVNGTFAQKIDGCYANARDWTGIRAVSTEVHLKAGKNTVKLYNDQGNGPSIDRIALAIPNENLLLGDLNFDLSVDARDLSLLKRFLTDGFTDAKVERVSDFNQDGKINGSDAAGMVSFLTQG